MAYGNGNELELYACPTNRFKLRNTVLWCNGATWGKIEIKLSEKMYKQERKKQKIVSYTR